jgi:hypothetical protein
LHFPAVQYQPPCDERALAELGAVASTILLGAAANKAGERALALATENDNVASQLAATKFPANATRRQASSQRFAAARRT